MLRPPVLTAALTAVITAVALLLWPSTAFAEAASYDVGSNLFLNSFEVVAGFAAALMAFASARTYREGRLGKGMTWVAVGMMIMAFGHLILVVRRTAKFDPLGFLGTTGSILAFFCAVFASFIASALGFWLIRRASSK